MKSKEEILKRNTESIAKCNVKYNVTHQGILNAMEEYATQCQEDMAKDVEYWQGEFDHWHKQAMEMANKKYTEEDIREAIAESWNSCEDNEGGETFTQVFNRIINSLNKQD